MKRIGLICLLLVVGRLVSAQVSDYAYFPAQLMVDEGVKMVSVFETRIDDPTAQAGVGNKIRLAHNQIKESYFDVLGHRIRTLYFKEEGRLVTRELLESYDGRGRKLQERMRVFNTNYSDSTKLLQTQETDFRYGHHGELSTQSSYFVSADSRVLHDSVAYFRNAKAQLETEVVVPINPPGPGNIERRYAYDSKKIVVTTVVAGFATSHEEIEVDELGRKVKVAQFAEGETVPRIETLYSYDPRGWLAEVRYMPNWAFFQKAETVVSRINKYDDHGKLVEVQEDFGDGKRLFEFYDYSYFIEEN